VSACCKEDYGIPEAWQVAQARGITALGISDHDVPFKNGFLKKHYKITSGLENVFLGLETSIRSESGKIMVSKRNLALLDYLMVSEHIHIMSSWTLLRKGRKYLEKWWTNPEMQYKVEKFYKKHARMTLNALKKYKPDILAHPWRFPWHRAFFDNATLEVYEPVLQIAQKYGVHVEISRAIMSIVDEELQGNLKSKIDYSGIKTWDGEYHHEVMQPVEFLKQYFRTCKELGVKFTLGSDAHRIEDIGKFPKIEVFMKHFNISEKDIIFQINK